MIKFILNNELISTEFPSGGILLDFIRKSKQLSGTKIGCREGDCGACTVLIGSINNLGRLNYSSVASCLTPISSVHGKHVVTIEGINLSTGLTPVQHAIVNNNGTQCGFCTPGFIVSLTGYAFSKITSISGVKESISGNICRCTGYKSIEKASKEIEASLSNKPIANDLTWLIDHGFIPSYFNDIHQRLLKIDLREKIKNENLLIGGGTDIYVSKADELHDIDVDLVSDTEINKSISINNGICTIGAAATTSDILNFKQLQNYFPEIHSYFKLISSLQIRNSATLGGNLVNASPIADLAIFFLGLNSKINISDKQQNNRTLFLKDFFKGYKSIDLSDDELIQELTFILPSKNQHFNFEKVSKRTHLDIASVNSAICITVNKNIISNIDLSAGGISPIPLYLKNTCAFLKDKELSSLNIRKAHCVLKEEISPISDVRGSKEYKRMLMRQIYYAHFIKLFPDIVSISDINV